MIENAPGGNRGLRKSLDMLVQVDPGVFGVARVVAHEKKTRSANEPKSHSKLGMSPRRCMAQFNIFCASMADSGGLLPSVANHLKMSAPCGKPPSLLYQLWVESCAPSVFWPLLVLMQVFRTEVANRYFRPSSIRSPLAPLRTLNLGVYGYMSVSARGETCGSNRALWAKVDDTGLRKLA